jgi:glutaredoxin 3
MMLPVRVYTTRICGYCTMAKRLLRSREIPYEEFDVSQDHEVRAWLVKTTGQRTVPQIFIGEKSVGGYRELSALARSGQLEALLHA